jgi:hypothetical protein
LIRRTTVHRRSASLPRAPRGQLLLCERPLDEERRLDAERLGHVLDLGQIVEIVQTKANQKLFRRRVHEWPADDRLATDDLDQMTLEQRVQHPGGVHAANLGDLQRGDRLSIGDDRQRLERLNRQSLRTPLMKQAANPLVQIGARDDLISARHFHQLQAARAFVILFQFGDGRLHVFLGFSVEQLVNGLSVSGSGRREDQGFDDRFQLGGATPRQGAER